MTKRKLPPATAWQERDIADWNSTTFHAYLSDKHRELFGIDYVPMRSWNAEKGMIGDIIGTKSGKSPKPRKASNEALKRFIDVTFEGYRPSAQYPGTSFGFMWSYRKTDWQRIQAEELAQARRQASVEAEPSAEELTEWW